MSSSPIEVMGRPERSRESRGSTGILLQLDQLKGELINLRDQENLVPPDVGAQRMLETHKALDNLHQGIEFAKQGAREWSEGETVEVKRKAEEVEAMLPSNAPFWVQKLLGELKIGAAALAEQKHNDPGPTLGAVERTADIVGGRVAPMVAGGALGTSAAAALGLSAGLSTTAMIAGTVGGAVAAPIAVEAIASKIENPKARAVVKTALYGLMAGGAAYLAPAAVPALIISFGIAGAINLINWFRQRGAAAQRAPQVQTRAAPQVA